MRTTLHLTTTTTPTTTTTTSNAAVMASERSPWHSPVPYLFGGLAAMLGLIAFALLILACSYWKLSRDGNESEERDLESGNISKGDDGFCKVNGSHVFEEKIVVIMAGDDKPTFIATPTTFVYSKNSENNPHLDGNVSKSDGKESSGSSSVDDHDHDDHDDDEKSKQDEEEQQDNQHQS